MKLTNTALAIAALSAALLPATASAAPAPLGFNGMITVTGEPSGLGSDRGITNFGTWTATGALSGLFNLSEQTWFGAGTLHCVDTLTPVSGDAGTITVAVNARFVASTAQSAYVAGAWTITSGTGVYGSVTGNGDYSGIIDRTAQPRIVTETLSGHGS